MSMKKRSARSREIVNLHTVFFANKLLQLTLRVIRPYTDGEVEKRTGVRAGTIARWRDAKVNPNSKSLMFVLDKYGYTVGLVAKETGLPVRDLAAHLRLVA